MTHHHTLVSRLFEEAFNQRQFGALQEIIAENAVFYGSLDTESHGADGLREVFEMTLEAFPDLIIHVEKVVTDSHSIAIEISYKGSHSGELFGIQPTYQSFSFSGAVFLTITEGKISQGRIIGDTTTILNMLILEELAGE